VANVFVSTVVDAPADEVWGVIRDYNGLPSWLPGIVGSEIRGNGPSDRVGAVRVLTLEEGPPVVETLLGLSDVERSQTYRIDESGLGVVGYVATLSVRPVTDGDRSYVEWIADFDVMEGFDAAERVEVIGGAIFKGGLDSLRDRFAS
jgi:hypothetical protein